MEKQYGYSNYHSNPKSIWPTWDENSTRNWPSTRAYPGCCLDHLTLSTFRQNHWQFLHRQFELGWICFSMFCFIKMCFSEWCAQISLKHRRLMSHLPASCESSYFEKLPPMVGWIFKKGDVWCICIYMYVYICHVYLNLKCPHLPSIIGERLWVHTFAVMFIVQDLPPIKINGQKPPQHFYSRMDATTVLHDEFAGWPAVYTQPTTSTRHVHFVLVVGKNFGHLKIAERSWIWACTVSLRCKKSLAAENLLGSWSLHFGPVDSEIPRSPVKGCDQLHLFTRKKASFNKPMRSTLGCSLQLS